MSNNQGPPSFSLPQGNVVELGDRMAMRPEIRAFIATLKVGLQIAEALETVMPSLKHHEQRILATIVAFRLQGTMMPASPELFAHLPLTAKITESELFAATQEMTDGDLIEIFQDRAGGEMNFAWPALERLIHTAIQNMDVSPILGPHGQKIR